MQLSTSLHELPIFSKLNLVEGDFDLETVRSNDHAKPLHALERESTTGYSFSKEKSSLATPTKGRKWIRAAVGVIVILLLFLFIYICSRYLSTYLSHEASEYYVILDCGSTSTRVYVYDWSINRNKGHSDLPIVLRSLPEGSQRKFSARSGHAYQRMETEPGFHKLVHNETGLKAAIMPLLQWAERQIPKRAHRNASLFLYATAGVRRLRSSDSEWLLDKAWNILKSSSFFCKRDWVKIITGMEEAYYGWIALNHHMGMLGSSPSKKTFGALDMGGSSLQVTFETEKPMHDETSINLRIGTVSHYLSAYSLSGYGLNDAFDKSVSYLLKSFSGTAVAGLRNGKVQLRHPCLHMGYREEYTCPHCATLNQEENPLIGGRISSGHARMAGMVIELLGAPNWEECSALARIAVNLSEWSSTSSAVDCRLKPCALSDNLPRPHGQFYAMSGFFVVFRFFNLTSEATLDDVLNLGKEFCGKKWEVAKSSVAPQPFIEQYCFRAPYIASLLREGLQIKDNQVVIGSGSITWTLGVALAEAGRALSSRIDLQSYKIFHTDINPTYLLLLLLVSIILLLCALSCVSKWTPGFLQRSYLPLFRHNSATNLALNKSSPFLFQRWSPINSGDGRVKTPLSPTVSGSEQHPFGMGYGFSGSTIQLTESSLHPLGVSHSYSTGSLGQIQSGDGMGSFWPPHRGQTTLSSRRSQSREDLSASLAEAHITKV
ncbi:probable apyrase 7 [Phoenix dactylifera]|uniref:Probable apyrase 7 n=1 Tax=Phoenix dactylifera TaxID=42345 RepID=A0A8B7MT05_PHODC|nr:probable apyrase 7 [Phoenix dactylifera]XP_017697016.2 probable apyrase 7 [Phoenix dactylifera]XP_038983000.1 probable apyrase 7 [Phoenix dactylifera]